VKRYICIAMMILSGLFRYGLVDRDISVGKLPLGRSTKKWSCDCPAIGITLFFYKKNDPLYHNGRYQGHELHSLFTPFYPPLIISFLSLLLYRHITGLQGHQAYSLSPLVYFLFHHSEITLAMEGTRGPSGLDPDR